MSPSDLTLIYENNNGLTDSQRSVYLLCVFRDEELLLDYFINYYKALGVSHFIMVDNLSEDDGVDYLKHLKDINIKIYQAEGSYRDAEFGTGWINQLLEKHCKNQYCFTLDVDELFYLDKSRFTDLQQLIVAMESQNSNVVGVTLLDMYPKKTNDSYQKGVNFLRHSTYFDDLNPDFYRTGFLHGSNVIRSGGVRERVLNTTVCLHKFPFFKYDFQPLEVAAGIHMFQDKSEVLHLSEKIRLFEYPSVLLHFKFIKPDLGEFFKRRVMLNQDWDDSVEYKSYVNELSDESGITFFDENYSRKMEDSQSLEFFYDFPDKEIPHRDVIQPEPLEEEKPKVLTRFQKTALFIFALSIRPFLTKKLYLKLKRKPTLFFKDSKSTFVRKIGCILKIA